MAYTISHVHHILTAVFCTCAIGHGFLLPHPMVTDPLQSMYHSTRMAGRDARASWFVTRNAYPSSSATEEEHVANSYSRFPPNKKSYAINEYQHYTDEEEQPLHSIFSTRKRRSILGDTVEGEHLRFTRRLRKPSDVIMPVYLDQRDMLTGQRATKAIWLPSKRNTAAESTDFPHMDPWLTSKHSPSSLPKIATRARWLPNKRTDPTSIPVSKGIDPRANWLPVKRLPSTATADSESNGIHTRANWLPVKRLPSTGNQVDMPNVRANWLPVKKDMGDTSNIPHHVELEARARWLPSKKDSGDNRLGDDQHQGIDSRASWLPSKKTEYTDQESLKALQNDGSIHSRASWQMMKKDHPGDLLSEGNIGNNNNDDDAEKRALWLPNKRQDHSQEDHGMQSRASWLYTKKKSETKSDANMMDDVEEESMKVTKGKLKETVESSDKGETKALKRKQRSLSKEHPSRLTVSPMGHFINGRSYDSTEGQDFKGSGVNTNDHDNYGFLLAGHSKDLDPPYLDLFTSNDDGGEYDNNNINNQYDHPQNQPWMLYKRIPTSRAISDHEKMKWDSYNTRAMWLPMRDVAEKRIPTERAVYYSDPYQNLDHGFFPNHYQKRIPTERDMYDIGRHNLAYDKALKINSMHKRIPTERALYLGGLDSMYDANYRLPSRQRYGNHAYSGQQKRIPTERGLYYSDIPTN